MRIDPNTQASEALQPDPAQDPKASTTGQTAAQDAAINGGVQVQLSTSAGQVAALAQQAAAAPPVRTDRVDALRQQIRDGNYNVSNEQVAAAMYSDMATSGGTNE
ncbi:MAG TPA: flagellar biosynthesis anti-sigma factor FlgM [Candidatus Baltobacteraceae bacterium]|jgi:negative regulator of flagellin synthesis FlgM|nr:flagellar biosynthesis anti-sigma factor FlgM [Candidatus Baltobacteraceae bacterium]